MSLARHTIERPLPQWTPSHAMDQPSRDIDELIREIEAAEPNRPSSFDTYTVEPPAPIADTAAEPPPPPHGAEEMIVVDLRPRELSAPGPAPEDGGERFGLGAGWGATWRWAAQGWVDDDSGRPQWRPVVTTTTELAKWDVDTYLGIVAGEAAVTAAGRHDDLGDALEQARRRALDNLSADAASRGAHAIVGVRIEYTAVDRMVIVSATGTAATLRDR
ncbi:MAG: heavy metal-binding domain-containing protein [Acidimicrobiia bacterium]